MFHRWAAPVLVLALCTMSAKNAAGQSKSQETPREHGEGSLAKPHANASSPESLADFHVGSEVCTDSTKQYVVSLRILNILGMPVAHFTLQGPLLMPVAADSSAPPPATSNATKLSEAKLACGSYRASWDGKLPSGKDAPPGTYVLQLLVDKKLAGTQKLYLGK